MTIGTHWVRAAAEEIENDIDDNTPYTRAIEYIIEAINKHCPFKPDTAYREITNADYPSDQPWRDAGWLRMYAEKIRNGTAAEFSTENASATLDDIANRMLLRSNA